MNRETEADIDARTPKGWNGIATPLGWDRIVEHLHREIADLFPDYEVYQVKEKFGSLRYYCSVDNEECVEEMIREAQRRSIRTCQLCGDPGRLREIQGWFATLCDAHAS